jgi:hypothetical protein
MVPKRGLVKPTVNDPELVEGEFYSWLIPDGETSLFTNAFLAFIYFISMCRREDLNLQGFLHMLLRHARLPIPPLRLHKMLKFTLSTAKGAKIRSRT